LVTEWRSPAQSVGTGSHTATAEAGINVALVKYWGKRDAVLNLPAVGSLSLTLDRPGTRTRVRFDPALNADRFVLDEAEADAARVTAVLDDVRARAGVSWRAEVFSENTVPTAAGLASSASGFAALGLAAWTALGLPPGDPALVDVVRRGSGSAPRSLHGGFVELDRETGGVRPLLAPDAWDVRLVIAVTTLGPKDVGSREGMASSAETSPYFPAWVESHAADMAAARRALEARDLPALGEVMEHSTLKMHACMLATRPPLFYWRPATLAAIETVRALRRAGTGAWFTCDAGPHVKVLCAAADAPDVADALRVTEGVRSVDVARPGPGAQVVAPC
jgi:diphosphomevalonate decarboxylase